MKGFTTGRWGQVVVWRDVPIFIQVIISSKEKILQS
jgi:hypothetical protein